jgi:hypothetical protein
MNSPDALVRAIVAAHGDLAAGLVSAVERITGRGSVLATLTNAGLGADEMEATVRERIERDGIRAIFTDLPSGSWTMAARRAMRGNDDVVLGTGVNLGGIHHKNGRVQRLRYVFLSPEEENALRALEAQGVAVTARDVPGARPIPLSDVLSGKAE